MNNLTKHELTKILEADNSQNTIKPSREEVWLRAWCTVAGCVDAKDVETAHSWAKHCLQEFDRVFSDD